MDAALTLRRLGPGDLPGLRALNAMFAAGFGEDGADYAAAPPPDAWLADLLDQPHVILLAADVAGATVGGILAYELTKPEQARREIYLYDLAVLEGWRRRGVATALIGRLCAIARDRGAWAVFVQADHGDDPAIALYTRLGQREDVLHFDLRL